MTYAVNWIKEDDFNLLYNMGGAKFRLLHRMLGAKCRICEAQKFINMVKID